VAPLGARLKLRSRSGGRLSLSRGLLLGPFEYIDGPHPPKHELWDKPKWWIYEDWSYTISCCRMLVKGGVLWSGTWALLKGVLALRNVLIVHNPQPGALGQGEKMGRGNDFHHQGELSLSNGVSGKFIFPYLFGRSRFSDLSLSLTCPHRGVFVHISSIVVWDQHDS
jgi:hypothetical protein